MKHVLFSYSVVGEYMKKGFIVVLCLVLQLSVVHGESYCVLVDGDNTIVDEKDMNKPQSVASISKIMSAIIALEKGNLKDTWTCGKEVNTAYGSMVYLKEGQRVSLESLVYGLMLRSGNDAAIAIATRISGSEESFVKEMNQKAKKIGMLNTMFRNASGLDEKDGGNVSTAYDMALLMSYAMKNPTFRKITNTKYYTSDWKYHWKNKNKLLFEYPFTNGGKTGFTKKAGRTLVSSAIHDGVENVVVTLNMGDDFKFHEDKHTEVFNQVDSVEVLQKGIYTIGKKQIMVKEPLCITLHKDGSDKLNISSHFESDEFVVEIQKNKTDIKLYSYPVKSTSSSFFRSLFS